jgi:hypothetical protein
LDVLEGAPVEVLAADVSFATVDQEILGVQDPARELLHLEQSQLDSLRAREAVEDVVIRLGHLLLAQEAHADAARRCFLDRGFDRIETAPGLAAGVELGEIERLLRAVDHVEPHLRSVGNVGMIERRLDRRTLDELDR